MPMDWGSSNKHYFGGFERIFIVEFKLKCIALADVDSAFRHGKTYAPDWSDFAYYLERQFFAILSVDVLRFLRKSDATFHF